MCAGARLPTRVRAAPTHTCAAAGFFFLLSLLFLSALAPQVQHRKSKQPTLNIKVSLPQVQPRVTREITASTSVLTMDTLTFACVMTDTC